MNTMELYDNIYHVKKIATQYLEEQNKTKKQQICDKFINILVDKRYSKLPDKEKINYCDKIAKKYISNCNKMFEYY